MQSVFDRNVVMRRIPVLYNPFYIFRPSRFSSDIPFNSKIRSQKYYIFWLQYFFFNFEDHVYMLNGIYDAGPECRNM